MSKTNHQVKKEKVNIVKQESPKVEEAIQNSSPEVRLGSFADLLSKVDKV
jgi:hypothetical protein